MRGEVLVRVTTLQQKHDTNQPIETTDTIDKKNKSYTYNDLAAELRTLQVDDTERTTKILFCCQNVKLYCVSIDGSVTSTSESLELVIFQLTGCGHDNNVNVIGKYCVVGDIPNFLLQVGSWTYPLIPGTSPCYRTDYNGFIFPDIHSNVEGM